MRGVLVLAGLIVALGLLAPEAGAARHHHPQRVCKKVRIRVGHGRKRRVRVCATRRAVRRHKPRIHKRSGGFAPPAIRRTGGDEGDSPRLPVGPYRAPRAAPISVPLQGAAVRRGQARAAGAGVTVATTRLLSLTDFPASVFGTTGVHAAQEPSVTSGAGITMYALNWDAGYSTDGGQTFTELDPYTTFPSNNGGFCCDQVVAYDSIANRFIWLLQYNGSGGENVIRVAYASPRNLLGFGTHAWSWFDLPSHSIAGAGKYLDQPKIGFTDRYVYLNMNQGKGASVYKTVIVRIPHASFAGQIPVGYGSALLDPWSLRVAQEVSGATEYFVGHKDTSTLRVASVDDNSNYILTQDVKDQTIADHNWTTTTPGGDDMLARQASSQGSQVTGVTQDGDNNLWASWSEGRDVVNSSGNVVPRTGAPTQPHIGVAVLSVSHPTLGPPPVIKLAHHWDYWNFNYSLAMPDLATTKAGEVGIVFNYGGGTAYLEHTVGFLTGGLDDVTVQASNSDPTQTGNPAGDYLTVRPAGAGSNCLLAAGGVSQGNHVGYPAFTIFSRNGYNCKPRVRPPITPVSPPVSVAPPPETTSLQLACPSAAQAGQPYSVSGTLSPAIGGARITLTYTSSDTSVAPVTHTVFTGADGKFSDAGPNDQTPQGTETIDAKYAGDASHSGSQMSCRFTVDPFIP